MFFKQAVKKFQYQPIPLTKPSGLFSEFEEDTPELIKLMAKNDIAGILPDEQVTETDREKLA